jgi:hypothetical protein
MEKLPQSLPKIQTSNMSWTNNLLIFLGVFSCTMMTAVVNSGPAIIANNYQTGSKSGLQRAITFTEPTVPLQFRDVARKKPKKKNLKKSRLLRKMGQDFSSQWMRIEEPANPDLPRVRNISDFASGRFFCELNFAKKYLFFQKCKKKN